MGGKKKTGFKSVISVIVFLLVIVLAVGLIVKYIKAGDKVKDLFNPAFRVEYDGKEYKGDNNVIMLPLTGQAQFKVKGAESYKVTLIPNVTSETDFTYEIGDTVYRYSQADLSKVFINGDSIKNGSFYLNCVDDYSLESVLLKVHGGTKIVLNGGAQYPYLLTFTADGATIKFLFGVDFDIDLSESNIIF
ncbi:MAG: hypothetical protein K2L37_03160 [Lactobacillus sp.]|nr:hypothetical protein [Lactobacillus sp.]